MIVETIYGPMNDSHLEHKWGAMENEHERTTWSEYYLAGQLVHRSAHVTLKEGLGIAFTSGAIGG